MEWTEESTTVCSPSVTSDRWEMPRGRDGKRDMGRVQEWACSGTQVEDVSAGIQETEGSSWENGVERQLSFLFENTLVTLWVTPKWESLHTGLVTDERKSWSGIDVSTSERLGHSSGGMFVLLGGSECHSWGCGAGNLASLGKELLFLRITS